jgi:hypothetical protein
VNGGKNRCVNEAVSREESDFARILLKGFEECSELNDYVEAARLLIFKEQQNKHRLPPRFGNLLHQRPLVARSKANLHFIKR